MTQHDDQSSGLLPRDLFSLELRGATSDPGALHASTRVDTSDFYGNAETWAIDTFRRSTGRAVVFLQRSSAADPLRLVIPDEIVRAIARQGEQIAAQGRRRAGHRLVAQRKERGDVLGNPDALKRARKARKAKKTRTTKGGAA